jgi:hypothetical protein
LVPIGWMPEGVQVEWVRRVSARRARFLAITEEST